MNHNPRILINILMLVVLALSGLLPAAAKPPIDAVEPTPSSSLLFIENAGQFAEGARFQVLGTSQGTVWLAQDAIWLTTVEPAAEAPARSPFTQESGEPDVGGVPRHGAAIKLTFVDSNPQPRLEPFNRLDTHVSYFLGRDPAGWHADVPVWGGVRYVDLYPGIDLELAGEAAWMVPRLVARPGANLGAVRLRVEGVDGAAVEGGMLRLSSAAGEVSWPLLQADGAAGGARVQPRGAGVFEVVSPLHAPRTQATTAPADDPSDLLYSTFLGGSGGDNGEGIAVDGTGAAYFTGITSSFDFPSTPGAFDTVSNLSDAFVAKLDQNGSSLEYATFLGGSSYDQGHGIAVDKNGMAYVIGWTQSPDFPVTPDAFDTILNLAAIFVAKLSPTGSALEYATFLDGYSGEWGRGIAVDSSGSAYVTGNTESSDFPITPGAFDTSFDGGYGYSDAFVAKLNTTGSALDYATFLGGSVGDDARGIAVDGDGAAYVTGYTQSYGFPTTPGAFDTEYNGGYYDIFVTKLNAAGSALDYSTFLGGADYDEAHGIAVDSLGAAFVTGHSRSSDFPTTPGAFDPTDNPDWDTFVVKLNPTGSALVYSTLLGGISSEYSYGIAVNENGAAYITGYVFSPDFPTTCAAFDRTYNTGDAFVARVNAAGSGLDYATFLGGSVGAEGYGVVADSSGAAIVIGRTISSDFPTTLGAFDTSYNFNRDAFVTKLMMEPTTCVYLHLPLLVKTP